MPEVKLLFVEDSENDALLIIRHLEQNGFNLVFKRVETPEELSESLSKKWDLVLSDYLLPKMNGLDAFKLVKQTDPDLPFILVSGNIGEETAVEAMRSGVHDYILKDNLQRLVPALVRELKEAQLRRDHRQAQYDLELAREEMERQKRHEQEMILLSKLVSGIAHEVRNPLNAISALLEALFQEIGDNELSEIYKPYVTTQVERLNKLMKSLLELGRTSDVGSFVLFDLEDLCRSAIQKWNNSENSCIVSFENKNSISIKAKGDFSRLQQVLNSIFENSRHFSPKGCTIRLILEKKDKNAVLSVIDNGSGIKPEHLDKVFDPFFTTRKAGTGLSLGIARRVIESHGGDLQISNNEHLSGCTVTISLPLV